MAKATRTARQLESMIMNEARTHTECSDLTGVIIARSSGDPNWTVSDLQNSRSSECASTMGAIILRLQHRYSLA
jgi:hypothetical protein